MGGVGQSYQVEKRLTQLSTELNFFKNKVAASYWGRSKVRLTWASVPLGEVVSSAGITGCPSFASDRYVRGLVEQ